jgi:hypothetical protein
MNEMTLDNLLADRERLNQAIKNLLNDFEKKWQHEVVESVKFYRYDGYHGPITLVDIHLSL